MFLLDAGTPKNSPKYFFKKKNHSFGTFRHIGRSCMVNKIWRHDFIKYCYIFLFDYFFIKTKHNCFIYFYCHLI